MNAQPNPFTYTPLDFETGPFRLLRLKKGTGQRLEGELIHGTIQKHDGQYEAISYTWGNSAIKDFIYIDGQPLGITYNLSLVLRDLRLPDVDRILWNDATCINQKDLVEQGHQVQQMGKIYKGARTVLFCLGRPTELTDFLLDTISTFQKEVVESKPEQIEDSTADHEQDDQHLLQPLWEKFAASLESKHYMCAERLVLALECIMSGAWFRRVWVVQEVYNAREGFVHCGRKSVPAAFFSQCSRLIADGSNTRIPRAAEPLLEMMSAEGRKTGHALREGRSLCELIRKFSSTQASHEYDRIYALLGMASDARGTGSLVPDYTISTNDVIKHTIRHFCKTSENISGDPPIGTISTFIELIWEPTDSTLLLWAAQCEFEPLVRYTLQQGALPTHSGRDGRSLKIPLVEAALIGNEAIVRLMLSMGGCDLNLNVSDESGHTALAHATDKSYVAIVKLLLDTGRVNINSSVQGPVSHQTTVLGIAAYRGNQEIVELLLETGEVNADTRFGALREAVDMGHEGVVGLLLATDDTEDDGGRRNYSTFLSTAASRGHPTIVQRLLDTGRVDVNFRDSNEYTPLHHAARNGREAVVEVLLGADGMEVDSRDDKNWTPLHLAADSGSANIVKLLLATGRVEVDLKNERNGGTPFLTAAKSNYAEVMKLLYETGDVDVNHRDYRDGRTAIWWAATGGYSAAMKMLLNTGEVDINIKTDYNVTPYMQAVRHENKEVAEMLLATGQVDDDAWDQELPDRRPYDLDGNPYWNAEDIRGMKLWMYPNYGT